MPDAPAALDLLREVQLAEINGRLCPRPESPQDRCCPVCRDLWRRIEELLAAGEGPVMQSLEAAGAKRFKESAQARRKSTLFLAEELIRSLMEPASFWRSFKCVKLDSEDSEDYGGERVITIVAKGEAATLLSDAYDEAVAGLPEGERDSIS